MYYFEDYDMQDAKRINRVRDILQGQIDDQNLGKLFRGGAYDQSMHDVMDEREAMEKYWKNIKDNVFHDSHPMIKYGGAKKRKAKKKKRKCNAWIRFVQAHKGSGKSLKELARLYKAGKCPEGGVVVGGRKRQSKAARMREKKGMEKYWAKKEHRPLKYYQTQKDRRDEKMAMQKYWMLKKGMHPKYQQSLRDRMDEALGMDRYWNYNRPHRMGGVKLPKVGEKVKKIDMLKKLKRKQLNQIAKRLGMRGYSTMKKPALARSLVPALKRIKGTKLYFDLCRDFDIEGDYMYSGPRKARKTAPLIQFTKKRDIEDLLDPDKFTMGEEKDKYRIPEIRKLRIAQLRKLAEELEINPKKMGVKGMIFKNKKELGSEIIDELDDQGMIA